MYFLAILLCLTPSKGLGAGTYDGNWAGTTNQGFNVSFKVDNDVITFFKIKYSIQGVYCKATIEKTISGGTNIVSNSFSISGKDFDMDCWDNYSDYNYTVTFSDISTGSGTWSAESCYCGGSDSGTFTVSLAGISVSPTSFNFQEVPLGSSQSQTFTVSNANAQELTIGSLAITGSDSSEFSIQNDNCSSQTIPAAGTCTFDAVFSPTSEGQKGAEIEIPSNDPALPTLEVSLNGSTPVPDISVAPASLGEVVLTGMHRTITFTITNSGNGELDIDTLSITGEDASKFNIQNDNCSGQTVSTSGTCTFDVGVSSISTDELTAAIQILSNDPDTPTLNVPCNVLTVNERRLIYSQSFANGLPGTPWTFYSSNGYGRIEAVDGRLRMDVSEDQNFTLNEAVLTQDLSECRNIILYFFQAEFGDEKNALPSDFFDGHSNGDGVAISNDGTTWYTILNADDLDQGNEGEIFSVNLDAHIANIRSNYDPSFVYNSTFMIKFQQYDNHSYSADGREWDIVVLTGNCQNLAMPWLPLLLDE